MAWSLGGAAKWAAALPTGGLSLVAANQIDKAGSGGGGGGNKKLTGMTDQQIIDAFSSEAGREPTSSEIERFKNWSKDKSIKYTAYEVGQLGAATPEAQLAQLQKYSGLYSQNLAQNDQNVMGDALAQLRGQFGRLGRSSSSGYLSAYADAASKLSQARSQQTAQFYGGGLQNILGAQQGQQQMLQSFPYQQKAAKYGWDLQKSALEQQQAKARQQELWGLGGAVLGAGVGALVPGGGALGASVGAGLGSSLGRGVGMFAQ